MKEALRIAVFGTESTGKTQLAEKLGAHFRVPWVPEYAREFWDQHGGVIGLEDMVPIAREQWRREDAAAEAAKTQFCLLSKEAPTRAPMIICDTDSLTTMLWSDLLYGTCPDEVRRGAEQRCRHYALYLLLDTDVPWTPDPQRAFPDPDDRDKCRRIWRSALERRHLPFVEIQGDWAGRERAAIAAVEKVLRG